mgnify:CR=1 FL=1
MGRQPWPHYIGDQEVWFLEPERTLVRLQDLRKPLATQRRYGGGYDVTVLAHLALCTALSSDSSRLHRAYAAAHDLHEAIVIDVPSSLKPLLPDYREIEDAWAAHVHRSVGLAWPLLPGAERRRWPANRWGSRKKGSRLGAKSLANERISRHGS